MTLRALPLWLLLGVTLLADANAHAGAGGAIAVMPFKNLNQDPELNWLRLGIAETMIADLRRSGLLVVERDQLDQALAEIALQGMTGTETSTAAKVGKLVGAHTVVVGGFQRAGKRIRITARFVTVETGVVRETAKATGPFDDIFDLQDRIVERLMGKKPAPRRVARARKAERPAGATSSKKRPSKQETLKAYELYARSLETSSQAERVRYLKQAIELDPDFRYAIDDLVALERRLEEHRKKADEVRMAAASKAREALFDEALPGEERARRAFDLLTGHFQAFRYRALLEDAERIYRLDLPPYGSVDVREYASFCIFHAHMMLKQTDLALQAGERHLKEFPGGMYSLGVESSMQSLIDQKKRDERAKDELRAEFAEIDAEMEEVRAQPEGRDPSMREQRLMNLAFRRCFAAQGRRAFDVVLEVCPRFFERYRGAPGAESLLREARWAVIYAHAERGEFAKARRLAERFLEEDPEGAESRGVKVQMRFWPRE